MIRLLILSLLFSSACSLGVGNEKVPERKSQVLGYLYSEDDWRFGLEGIDWSMYTDINLAFIQPDHTGKFSQDDVYHEIVKSAHENGSRVFISIGGGDPPEFLADLMLPEQRDHWTEQIVALVNTYGFDGVDVDLENSLINEHYAPFVRELSRKLKNSGKLTTAALASWNSDLIPDDVFGLFDWVNVMSYDATGPWDLENPGQHAPFEKAVSDIHYYLDQREIPSEKILLGLPFYGYGFGPGAPASLTYRQILEKYPSAYMQDSLSFPDGGVFYYNSPALIQRKTELAKEQGLGGVMIWHVLADTKNGNSLLDAVRKGMK
ncbi:glycosyl hydrolase family 18 protein [Cyclobacterium jeungdonense]|uniref:chitinase n=1 Tax=Cyclobacterium jeungdonense TaxID=708087 RepID=A0ABT8C7L3_9BACT|nr:glycosyl hydrolase family 18 protein [Cyclobacterium jeungdonense]MDN3688371.1 glycosyl hydrolase family 18 protein [Cyclobacterium jeungdonense]